MINQVILVGRLTNDVEVRTLDDGKNVAEITLAVQNPFKNAQSGEYETEFIKATLWQGLATSTATYCKKGSVVGIKGRISTRKEEYAPDKFRNILEVIAENITFISSKKEN